MPQRVQDFLPVAAMSAGSEMQIRPPRVTACLCSWRQMGSHTLLVVLHGEHVAVELGEPLTALHRLFQMVSCVANVGLDLGPKECRVMLRQVSRVGIAKFRVHTGF